MRYFITNFFFSFLLFLSGGVALATPTTIKTPMGSFVVEVELGLHKCSFVPAKGVFYHPQRKKAEAQMRLWDKAETMCSVFNKVDRLAQKLGNDVNLNYRERAALTELLGWRDKLSLVAHEFGLVSRLEKIGKRFSRLQGLRSDSGDLPVLFFGCLALIKSKKDDWEEDWKSRGYSDTGLRIIKGYINTPIGNLKQLRSLLGKMVWKALTSGNLGLFQDPEIWKLCFQGDKWKIIFSRALTVSLPPERIDLFSSFNETLLLGEDEFLWFQYCVKYAVKGELSQSPDHLVAKMFALQEWCWWEDREFIPSQPFTLKSVNKVLYKILSVAINDEQVVKPAQLPASTFSRVDVWQLVSTKELVEASYQLDNCAAAYLKQFVAQDILFFRIKEGGEEALLGFYNHKDFPSSEEMFTGVSNQPITNPLILECETKIRKCLQEAERSSRND